MLLSMLGFDKMSVYTLQWIKCYSLHYYYTDDLPPSRVCLLDTYFHHPKKANLDSPLSKFIVSHLLLGWLFFFNRGSINHI